jgi:hypothetical protein
MGGVEDLRTRRGETSMRHFRLLAITFLGILAVPTVPAQTRPPQKNQIATGYKIKGPEGFAGELYITVGGKTKKIGEDALIAWIIDGGSQVVYSARDGAGGFENEGESLRVYDVNSGRTRKILAEYESIEAVLEAKLTTGETLLLVRLVDGGVGASYFAIVDPIRGEIFHRNNAELISVNGDSILLAFYRSDNWDAINKERGWFSHPDPNKVIQKIPKVKPYKTEEHDLKRELKNRVIYNKPTNGSR